MLCNLCRDSHYHYKAWSLEAIEGTQTGDCLPEVGMFVSMKEAGKSFINRPPLAQRREDRSHGRWSLWQKVGKPGEHHPGIKSGIVLIQVRIRNVAITPRGTENQVLIQEIDSPKTGLFHKTEMSA
jgi:hypothetical protein